jgi:hypothetical protein
VPVNSNASLEDTITSAVWFRLIRPLSHSTISISVIFRLVSRGHLDVQGTRPGSSSAGHSARGGRAKVHEAILFASILAAATSWCIFGLDSAASGVVYASKMLAVIELHGPDAPIGVHAFLFKAPRSPDSRDSLRSISSLFFVAMSSEIADEFGVCARVTNLS